VTWNPLNRNIDVLPQLLRAYIKFIVENNRYICRWKVRNDLFLLPEIEKTVFSQIHQIVSDVAIKAMISWWWVRYRTPSRGENSPTWLWWMRRQTVQRAKGKILNFPKCKRSSKQEVQFWQSEECIGQSWENLSCQNEIT